MEISVEVDCHLTYNCAYILLSIYGMGHILEEHLMCTEKLIGSFLIIIVTACSVCFGAELSVGPGMSYTTIQSAINDANDFDVVIVEPGVYKENIIFGGNTFHLQEFRGAGQQTVAG